MKVRVGDIQPNPFRNIAKYPIQAEKVEALRQSIRTTGFWDNMVARKVNGGVEIAHGHHRVEALRQELGPDAVVGMIVKDLSDEDMLKIMANENMEEWSHSVAIENETIRSVVEAFAADKISLPLTAVTKVGGRVRFAPAFMVSSDRGHVLDRSHPYTAVSVADFLGWDTTKVKDRLSNLALIERATVDEAAFNGLSAREADALAKAINKTLKLGDVKGTKKAKERAEHIARRQAKEIAGALKAGDLATKDIAEVAAEMRREVRGDRTPDISDFAMTLARRVSRYLSQDSAEFEELFDNTEFLDDLSRKELISVLDSLIQRAEKFKLQFKEGRSTASTETIARVPADAPRTIPEVSASSRQLK